MTKKDLVSKLDESVVRCIIDDKLRQFTRNADLSGLNNGIDSDVLTNAEIKKHDKGANIGVFDLGNGVMTTITNAKMNNILGYSSD
jgi:hypothetical protein